MTGDSAARPIRRSPGKMSNPVRALVVDDEVLTAEAHAAYLRRIGGFEVVGITHDGRSTLDRLRTPDTADLLLLDINLPDTHGMQLVRSLRAAGATLDVIAITAVRDVAVVRSAISLGVVQYLIKPFTYRLFAERMAGYLEFRASLAEGEGQLTQASVDSSLSRLRSARTPEAVKGLSAETLQNVVTVLRHEAVPRSAAEVAERATVSRVTARRYLEHLAAMGSVEKILRYGTPGRPELGYRWK